MTVCVDEGERPVGEHVGGEPVGQADPLPDPDHLLVGGDRPGPRVDVGLPLHDELAAVIERSFERWLAAVSLPGDEVGGISERATAMAVAVAKALMETPDFLRLGLMLTLERRPAEPTARTRFLQVRAVTGERGAEAIRVLAPELSDASVRLLTTYAIAGADGLFIAREIGGDDVDLVALFELHARVLVDAVARELGAGGPS